MPAYLVSYDLNNPPSNPDYAPIVKRLTSLGAKRVLYSEWALRSNASAADLRDDMKKYVDSNDSVLVLALTGEAAWTQLMVSHENFKQILNG